VLDRTFEASAPNRKWIADFTYVWTAEGWLYGAAVIDLSWCHLLNEPLRQCLGQRHD
jgi:transposase InsO family protein